MNNKRQLKKLGTAIPFIKYLPTWARGDMCGNSEAHPVYVMTDRPRAIMEELDRLLKGQGGGLRHGRVS